MSSAELRMVKRMSRLKNVLSEYEDLFTWLHFVHGGRHIQVHPDIVAVIHPSKKRSLWPCKKTDKELKPTCHRKTDRSHRVGHFRICLDSKDLNKEIQRERALSSGKQWRKLLQRC